MKRTSKTEKRIAAQRQDDIAREQRTEKKRSYTEERLPKVLPTVQDGSESNGKPGPLRKDADALDRAVHELELENYRRRECGMPPMSYGQAQVAGMLSWDDCTKNEARKRKA